MSQLQNGEDTNSDTEAGELLWELKILNTKSRNPERQVSQNWGNKNLKQWAKK